MSEKFIPPRKWKPNRRILLAILLIALLAFVLIALVKPLIFGSTQEGLRKCYEGEFVVDEDSKAQKRGYQASTSILRDPRTDRKYFFKSHNQPQVFRQERRILQALDSASTTPQAVCYIDKPVRGIVMELAEGGDLLSDSWYRRDHPLRFETYDQLIYALAHFLASLASLHAQGYLHNDLRPGNVIFRHPHKLQVIDFGLSRKIGKKGFHSQCHHHSPPETAFLPSRKQRYQKINSTASDWYSFGVLGYFFMAKGMFCIHNDEDDACQPGQQDIFGPYKSRSLDPSSQKVIYNWNHDQPVQFPPNLGDFFAKLIVDDPKARDFYGNRLVELLNHDVFANINWDEISPKLRSFLVKNR